MKFDFSSSFFISMYLSLQGILNFADKSLNGVMDAFKGQSPADLLVKVAFKDVSKGHIL